MSTFVWNIFLKPNSETHFAMQVLENRVRRHAPRIRRKTRNSAEISAVRLSRSTRVPTSLKPAVQRLQAPATVTAPNSTYCSTISWIFHGVYVSVSSIQDLLCVMYAFLCVTALVCWCVCVCVRLCVCVCVLVCSSRRNIINKNWKWQHARTHAQTYTHKHTLSHTHTHLNKCKMQVTFSSVKSLGSAS